VVSPQTTFTAKKEKASKPKWPRGLCCQPTLSCGTAGSLLGTAEVFVKTFPESVEASRGLSLNRHVGVCPSPSGRGWRGAPGEGPRHACPHPALRATFSQ